MSDPNRLTRAYVDRQIERSRKSLEQIVQRSRVAAGRVIPETCDIAIHTGRRVEAAVMFLDICKFSARPSWTAEQQESLLAILSFFFTEMIRIVEDYGGVVEKNTGDGLMAYFTSDGAGGASASQKAVAAALTMFSATATIINPVLQKSGLQQIDFRVCLDYGPVTLAKVGAAHGFNGIVAIGATANVASEMLGFADPNTILMGTMALQGLPDLWRKSWISLKTIETGWYLTDTATPYAFWQYNGRWTIPA
jgi:class 3 adenylate cyclase